MKYSRWLPALFCTALSVVACSTNPVTGGRDFVLMSESQEISLGRQYSAETAKSLHPLTSTGKKLAIIRAPAGTRFAALARNLPLTNYPEEQLRLLNGLYSGGEPQASQWLKVVR